MEFKLKFKASELNLHADKFFGRNKKVMLPLWLTLFRLQPFIHFQQDKYCTGLREHEMS